MWSEKERYRKIVSEEKASKQFTVCLKIYVGFGEKRKKNKVLKIKKKERVVGCDGPHLYSQHLGDRGKLITVISKCGSTHL